MDFKIIYKYHWRRPCAEYEDKKEETTFHSDGHIEKRRFDHHGPNGHYRLVEKEQGKANQNDVKDLYDKLMNLVINHDGIESLCNIDAEVLLIEDGVKISVDAGLYKGNISASSIVEEFIQRIQFECKEVKK